MGLFHSKTRNISEKSHATDEELQEELSHVVYSEISKQLQHPPLTLKLIDIYHNLYERLFGPWGRVVGSYADCLSISSSDLDIILDHIHVYTTPDRIPLSDQHGLVIVTNKEEIPAGCCWLQVYQTNNESKKYVPSSSSSFRYVSTCGFTGRQFPRQWKVADVDGIKCLCSSDVCDHKKEDGLTLIPYLNRILPNWTPHGPAFRQKYFWLFDVDILQAFKCEHIPSVLLQWVNRTRGAWPPQEIIQNAISKGCHIVPISSKITSKEYMDFEFRFGCGEMEKVLIESWNTCQKVCFILLKIILKEFIEKQFPDQEILSSYVMKSLMFWMAEEIEPEFWQPKCTLICLQRCLQRLLEFIEKQFCPSYFIPEYNLFRTKIDIMKKTNFCSWFQTSVELNYKVLLHCQSLEFMKKYM